MRTLPSDCSDDDIRALVVEWWEMIVAGDYTKALEMFAHDDSAGIIWTPDTLKEEIATGCCMSPPRGVPQSLFGEDAPRYQIEVDRMESGGLDPVRYCGEVLFEPLPMKPYIGELTARLQILQVGRGNITLEFHDAHVM